MCVLVTLSDSFVISWTVAHQVSLPMELSRQEYWSGLLFPSPGDLPDSGIKPEHPFWLLHWQADSLPLNHLGRPYMSLHVIFSSHHLFCLYCPPPTLPTQEKKVEGTFLHDFAFSHSSLIWPLPQLAAEVLIYHEKVFLGEAWPRQQQEVQEIS